jgi:hypothetical protein
MGTQGLSPNWSIGVMEYWNDGLKGGKTRILPFLFSVLSIPTIPLFHYSTIPSFHWGIGGFLSPGFMRIGI